MAIHKKNQGKPLSVLVLAAGKGSRMGGDLPKALLPLKGRPMIEQLLDTVGKLEPAEIIVVVGVGGKEIRHQLAGRDLVFVEQSKPCGTGDAAKVGLSAVKNLTSDILILYGDAPLISFETLQRLLELPPDGVRLVTGVLPDAGRYGRVLRDKDGEILGIREAADCTAEELRIREYNSGVYLVEHKLLSAALANVTTNNSQKEHYLTDIVHYALNIGQAVNSVAAVDPRETLGANTPEELSTLERAFNELLIKAALKRGVYFQDTATTYIDPSVSIAPGVKIGANTSLLGETNVGADTIIEGSAYIIDSVVGEDTQIKFGCRIEGAKIGAHVAIGPFANIRPESHLEDEVKVGNFVETKKSRLRKGAKASHLSYIGDADVGEDANIGAGTITCNYDGVNKHKTTIGRGAFIGSNTSLIAPISIGKDVTIGAGSAISKDVPDDSLAVTRAPIKIKQGWKSRKR